MVCDNNYHTVGGTSSRKTRDKKATRGPPDKHLRAVGIVFVERGAGEWVGGDKGVRYCGPPL